MDGGLSSGSHKPKQTPRSLMTPPKMDHDETRLSGQTQWISTVVSKFPESCLKVVPKSNDASQNESWWNTLLWTNSVNYQTHPPSLHGLPNKFASHKSSQITCWFAKKWSLKNSILLQHLLSVYFLPVVCFPVDCFTVYIFANWLFVCLLVCMFAAKPADALSCCAIIDILSALGLLLQAIQTR